MPERRPAAPRRLLAPAACGLAAGSVAFLCTVVAWPEMVVPAWMVSRGAVLYRDAIEPYTPALILLTASAGKLAGFHAGLFRALSAVPPAACAFLLVRAVPRSLPRPFRAALALASTALVVLWSVYFGGPELWPDVFVAPFVLAATLVLSRVARTAAASRLRAAGLLLGSAILVKQTSAWVLLGAVVWAVVAGGRERWRRATSLAAWGSLPYLVFAVAWAALFRTGEHLYWTLWLPVSGHAAEIGSSTDLADLLEAVAPAMAFPAAGLLARAARGRGHRARPLPFLGFAVAGMAWPRWGLLHLAGSLGVVVLATLVAFRGGRAFLARGRRRSPSRSALAAAGVGAAFLACHVAVAGLGAGPLLAAELGGPVRYWDDARVREMARRAEAAAGPGGSFLNFGATYDNVYVRAATPPPCGLYVNVAFWFFLDKRGLDRRLTECVAAQPGLPVLFAEPEDPGGRLRRTAIHGLVRSRTEEVERLDERTTLRRVVR